MIATRRAGWTALWSMTLWSAGCASDTDAGQPLGTQAAPAQMSVAPAAGTSVAASNGSAGTPANAASSGGAMAASPARPSAPTATPVPSPMSGAGGAAPAVTAMAGAMSAAAPASMAAGAAAPAVNMAGASGGAAGSAGASGAVAGSQALPPAPDPGKISWTRCGNFDCASLQVPLDYAAPSGEKIKLALKRRAARGQRIGSLLINPGGPGGSAVDFLGSFVQVAGAALLQRFDVVAFDPRGVGASTPIECHSTLQKVVATDPSPDDEAEWKASDDAAKVFADECAQKYGKILPFMGTANVARDMDQVRAAVGDEKLTYLGFSYGTAIGARYAELFPQRVRALVLDGALDMSLTALDISLQQAQGFEQALKTYFGWCGAAANNCSWTGSMKPEAAFMQLAAAVETKPLSGRVPVGPGEFLLGVIAPLYGGEDGYRILSQELVGASRGDGSTIMSLVDSYLDRKQDGTYGNLQEANSAVNCVDAPGPDYAGLRAEEVRFRTASPIFGTSALTGLLVCAHWSVHAQQEPTPKAVGAAPILVVGTTGDPATPYRWAEALAQELESGVLLTYEGEGHTAYSRSVPCIDDAVEAYLIDGKVPEDGKRCAGNAASTPSRLMLQSLPMRGPWPAPRF